MTEKKETALKAELIIAVQNNWITPEQYRVLYGLVMHNEADGARKGLEKLKRRQKRQQKENEVKKHDSQRH